MTFTYLEFIGIFSFSLYSTGMFDSLCQKGTNTSPVGGKQLVVDRDDRWYHTGKPSISRRQSIHVIRALMPLVPCHTVMCGVLQACFTWLDSD